MLLLALLPTTYRALAFHFRRIKMNISCRRAAATVADRLRQCVSTRSKFFGLIALAAGLAITPAARADSYSFAFSGGGLSGSGVIPVPATLNLPIPSAVESLTSMACSSPSKVATTLTCGATA
jgi:hypothetical protein